MANAILGHRRFDGKPTTTAFTTSSCIDAAPSASPSCAATILGGLVQHDHVDVDTQVSILATIDQTGSAPLEDIVAALPGHPKPAGATLAMVAAGILAIDSGIVDANIRLRRALPTGTPDDDGAASAAPAPRPDGGRDGGFATARDGEPEGPTVREVTVPLYAPAIFWARGTDRARLRSETILARPGVYFALWGNEIYVGASKKVCARAARGPHLVMPVPADRIIAIVDRSGQLNWEEAQVAERLFYRHLEADGTLQPRHSEPSGGAVDAVSNSLVHDFVETAMVALRRANLLAPSVGTGCSLTDPAVVRPDLANGVFTQSGRKRLVEAGTYRLNASGIEALARVDGDIWTVLAGSEIRGSVVPSAHPSASQRRIELLHSGGLVKHGSDFRLTRDVAFGSATGAAHFVVGCKIRADIWEALDAKPEVSLQH